MINIIICDDNYRDATRLEKIVRKTMSKIEHKIYVFNDYDKNFFNIMNSEISNKIYILDIETPNYSGIDIAHRIRKKDFNSIIIFSSAHDDQSRVVAKKNLMSLNFINKFDDLENNLSETLKLALGIIGKTKFITLSSRGVVYHINLERVLYLTHDTYNRESIIVCDNATYRLKMNMKDIVEELDENFVQTHRACYVNKNRVVSLNLKLMVITFDDGNSTSLVSKNYVDEGVIK